MRLAILMPLMLGWALMMSPLLYASLKMVDTGSGELLPLSLRLAWFSAILLITAIPTVASYVFLRCYVHEIVFDRERRELVLRTARTFGSAIERWPAAAVESARFHSGAIGGWVRYEWQLPWDTIRIKGRRLPLVVDYQGQFEDEEMYGELFPGAGTIAVDGQAGAGS